MVQVRLRASLFPGIGDARRWNFLASAPEQLARSARPLQNRCMVRQTLDSATPYIPASAPRSADVVLYLDLDGVVHHEAVLWHPRKGIYMSPYQAAGNTLFEWLPHLEEVLAPFPAVALVLSSTWCIRPGYNKTLTLLPDSLRTRFIGGTFHKRVHGADPWTLASFRSSPRGVQVLADAQRRKPRHWVALDDDIEDWPQSAQAHLIACDGSMGLSCPLVRDALHQKLLQFHSPGKNRR